MAAFSSYDSDFSYVSALTSPDAPRTSNASLLYSAPSSPYGENAYPPYHLDAGKLDPSCDQTSSDSELDFEFNTSWGHVLDVDEFITSQDLESPFHEKPRSRGDSLPSMAFADELFCEGKVMPLKPPPCSYYESKSGNQSPIGSPLPRSPKSGFKVPFHRRSLWNDDYDPFMAALENVKVDSRARRTAEANDHRRTRSLSPFRGFRAESPRRSTDSRWRNHQENEQEPSRPPVKIPSKPLDHANPPYSKWAPEQRKQAGLQLHEQNIIQSPQQGETHGKVEEGKRENGECIVRESRGQRIRKFLLRSTSSSSTERENGVGIVRESKRQRIRKFLLRSKSSSSTGNKGGDETARSIWKPNVNILKRLSFKSTGSGGGGATTQNDEKRTERSVSTVARVTLVQYRPRLLLCLGYGLE